MTTLQHVKQQSTLRADLLQGKFHTSVVCGVLKCDKTCDFVIAGVVAVYSRARALQAMKTRYKVSQDPRTCSLFTVYMCTVVSSGRGAGIGDLCWAPTTSAEFRIVVSDT